MSAQMTAKAVLERELHSLNAQRTKLARLAMDLEGEEARYAESELWDLDTVIQWFNARLAH